MRNISLGSWFGIEKIGDNGTLASDLGCDALKAAGRVVHRVERGQLVHAANRAALTTRRDRCSAEVERSWSGKSSPTTCALT